MRGWYFYTIILSFLSGVLLASFIEIEPTMLWLSLVLAITLALQVHRLQESPHVPVMVVIILIFLFTPLGVLRMQSDIERYQQSPLLAQVEQVVTLSGVVVDEPDVRERTTRVVVAVGDDRLLVSVDRYHTVAYGDHVTVTGTLRLPTSFTGDLGRTFHYAGYLRVRNIGYVMSHPTSFVVIASREGHWLLHTLYDFKASFVSALQRTIPDPAAGLGVGLLLGVKQALGADLERAFRVTGVIHIVVLSGFNVMIVITAVMFLLGTILSLRPRVIIGLVAITLFALLVGLSATVVRATMMAGLLLLAHLMGRQYHILRALCLAGVIMVVVEPHILAFDVGFQLSFMATLGLVLIAPQFETVMGHVPSQFGIREFLLATIATQIAVLPLLAYHIGEVSLIALVVNVLILPLVPLAMALTFVAGLVALWWPAFVTPFALLAYMILGFMIAIVEWFAALPFAAVTLPVIPWYGVFIFYGVIGLSLYFWASSIGWCWPWEADTEVDIEHTTHDNQSRTMTSADINHWQIIDESTLKQVSDVSSSSLPQSLGHEKEPPIFFR